MAVGEIILIAIAFVVLLVASISDIRTREVPDSLNFALIGTGLGINLLLSLIYHDFSFIGYSIVGLLVFVLVSYGMYYSGQWGGGDSKLLMGLGALFGIRASMDTFMLSFLVSLLLVGAIYGVVWSIAVGIKNFRAVKREAKKIVAGKNFIYISASASLLAIFLFILAFLSTQDMRLALLILPSALVLVFPLWVFIRSMENGCMKKWVKPEQLTEGDWIAKEVIINGKRICGPKDLGIEKRQIKALLRLKMNGKIRRIMVKEGIPFVPSFFLAFICALVFRNYILLLLKTFI
ncbi:prepilin peptidase [Candidatus Woesearchaeota archaeon]|nr:prepilin peptidase [Candidatus Woesearchaeota archaeon]